MSLVLSSTTQNVGLITLNRPSALNALSQKLIEELLLALRAFDDDSEVGAIVLSGNERVFCAGADIKELKELTFVNSYMGNFLKNLNDGLAAVRKPVIAAVNGYALGGGCELALMCDIIYAGSAAKFGQPEVKIGTIPGAGGTQRLIRAVGKAKVRKQLHRKVIFDRRIPGLMTLRQAMEMILTGEPISAQEAESSGIVSRVFPDDRVVSEAIKTAHRISSLSIPVLAMAKEAVKQAEETSLQAGLVFERRLYHSTFGLNDAKEGMAAFLQKREAKWSNS